MKIDLPVQIIFRCLKCGGAEPITTDAELTDASIISCESCGAVACSWGELRERCMEDVARKLREKFGDESGKP